MKKRILYWALLAALILFMAGPQAMAESKGKKGDAGAPAGWEKGEKKGWKGDAPPAHEKVATEAVSEDTSAKEEASEEAGELKNEAQEESVKEK